MLTKEQKIKFVQDGVKEMQRYSVVGVLPLDRIPDKLLQSAKNKLKQDVRFILGRKSLIKRILEGDDKTRKLSEHVEGTSAILLSNDDPFALFSKFKSNALKLAAKPGQVAQSDVTIPAGETSIQPGQAVTDLKSAGINVQIQKGKVVIASDKVIVKKGDQISTAVSKALHTLDIKPFTAIIAPSRLVSQNIMFTKEILEIDAKSVSSNIAVCFNSALTLSMELGIVNAYTVVKLISRAYRNAIFLGTEAKIYDAGITDQLIARATREASALNNVGNK